jgi:hypothetical protein
MASFKVEHVYGFMKRKEYFVWLYTTVVLNEEYNAIVSQREINWYHKTSDAMYEITHKPMSLSL